MKKILLTVLVLVTVLCICGCGGPVQGSVAAEPAEAPTGTVIEHGDLIIALPDDFTNDSDGGAYKEDGDSIVQYVGVHDVQYSHVTELKVKDYIDRNFTDTMDGEFEKITINDITVYKVNLTNATIHDVECASAAAYLVPSGKHVYIVTIGAIEGEDQDSDELIKGISVKNYEYDADVEMKSETVARVEQTGLNAFLNQDYSGGVVCIAYVEVENTGNTNIRLTNGTFDFTDDNMHIVDTEDMVLTCPNVIAPGEKGYYFITQSFIDNSVASSISRFEPHFQYEESIHAPDRYEISDTAIRNGEYGGVVVTGRMTNNSTEDDLTPNVLVVFRGADGEILGIDNNLMNELPAGSTQGFEVSTDFDGYSFTVDDVDSYEVFACPLNPMVY